MAILIVFSFFGCKSERRDKTNLIGIEGAKNDTIFVTYQCGLIETFTAIKCSKIAEIQKEHPINSYFTPEIIEIIDTFIVDHSIITRIDQQLSSMRPLEDNFNEDARLFATLKYKDGRKKEICISNNYNPKIKIDGIPYSTNNELVYLLKNYSGYYYWGVSKSDIESLKELQDTSFQKESIKTKEDNPAFFEQKKM